MWPLACLGDMGFRLLRTRGNTGLGRSKSVILGAGPWRVGSWGGGGSRDNTEGTGTQRGTALEVHNGADAAEANFLPPQQGRLWDSGGLHTLCKGPCKTLWETRHVTLNIRWLLMNLQCGHTKSLQGKHHCHLDSPGGLCWRGAGLQVW